MTSYLAARVEVYGEDKAAKRPVTLMDMAPSAARCSRSAAA